ncbi:hypothetical protein F4860DRAFT_513739 [Xylaria cubensis]|nr:hypothetical protein F4860DRAFT_513739 [Xylaria cubensis]
MAGKKYSAYYEVVNGKMVKTVTVEPDEHSKKHEKHKDKKHQKLDKHDKHDKYEKDKKYKKDSSSSGRTREEYQNYSYSSRHGHSHSTHYGEGGSRVYSNPIPRPSPASYSPYTNANMGYTNSYYSYPQAFEHQQYQYEQEPTSVYHRINEGVSYVRPWRYHEETQGSSSAAYFPSERASTSGAVYENNNANYPPPKPENVPSEPVYGVPLPIQQAIAKGKEAMAVLRETITIVLLHEWCMEGNNINPPSKDFKADITVIPVQRDKHGAFQPIEGEGKWGVLTGYHPGYDTYLSTIIIRVPYELRDVSEAKVKAAYRRFFAKARDGLLVGVPEIPFINNQDYKNFGMLFVFQKGKKRGSQPRLFDDYLCEDAVIRLQT